MMMMIQVWDAALFPRWQSLTSLVLSNCGLAALPTVAEPTAPAADNPLHPLALSLLRPQQVIMLGRPTLHRPVSALLADPAVPPALVNVQVSGVDEVLTTVARLVSPGT